MREAPHQLSIARLIWMSFEFVNFGASDFDTTCEVLNGIICDLAFVASTFGGEYWILPGMPAKS